MSKELRIYKEMIGKTIKEIMRSEDELHFKSECGYMFSFTHYQDCCERVWLDDVNGELDDLIGSPLTVAESYTQDWSDSCDSSGTSTFYKFATIKGYVDVTWRGESNGYYSEEVDFVATYLGE